MSANYKALQVNDLSGGTISATIQPDYSNNAGTCAAAFPDAQTVSCSVSHWDGRELQGTSLIANTGE